MNKEKFWNRLAKNYDDEVGEQTIAITKKYLRKSDIVLDYGCARGAYTIVLADEVKEIRGIDISSKMIEIARTKSEDISFETATIFDIHEQYDVILAFNLLHLLEDAERVIQKIYEILQPGGRFISVTTCMKENILLRIAGTFMNLFGILHINKFTISGLRELVSRKFDIVETEVFTPHLILIVATKKTEAKGSKNDRQKP
jgi:2-polyprenyl-3-methyl-5-hydroxy-6-metoxy-1,4-benzoquinol methylase